MKLKSLVRLAQNKKQPSLKKGAKWSMCVQKLKERTAGKSEDLAKGQNGDWKKEGYEIWASPNPIFDEDGEEVDDDPNSFTVYAQHPKHGDVGTARFRIHRGELIPDDSDGDNAVSVDENHQRKGLASGMYQEAENFSGMRVRPSSWQTEPGKALWNQPNAPFGKSEQLKKGSKWSMCVQKLKERTAGKSESNQVAVIAVLSRNSLLMLKRRDSGKWTFPGGHLEPKESFKQGAKRELFEETGIDTDTPMSPLGEPNKTPNGKVVQVFLQRLNNHVSAYNDFDPDQEASEFRWVPANKVLEKEILENLHTPIKYNLILKAFPEMAGEALEKSEDSQGMTMHDLGGGYSLHHSPIHLSADYQDRNSNIIEHEAASPHVHSWAIKHGDKTVGMVNVSAHKGYGEKTQKMRVSGSFVGAEHRGQGLGRKAYSKLADHYGGLESDIARSDDATKAWASIPGSKKAEDDLTGTKYSLPGDKKNPPVRWAKVMKSLRKNKSVMPQSPELAKATIQEQDPHANINSFYSFRRALKHADHMDRDPHESIDSFYSFRRALKHADHVHHNEQESFHKSESNNKIRQVADSYAATKGIKLDHSKPAHTVDLDNAKRIADAYDKMPHNPNHPAVKNAYDTLIKETHDQFKHIVNNGLKISRMKPGMENPYKGGSKDLLADITTNNHMWYYPTDQGFGSSEASSGDHPLLRHTGEMHDGHPLLANDMFRIVHDYFGHGKEGNSFGQKGEDNAWKHHMPMYTPEAQKALTTETRGQNSWVHMGPHGAHNKANPKDTIFADQKAGLLPDWTMEHPDFTPIKKEPVQKSFQVSRFAKIIEKLQPTVNIEWDSNKDMAHEMAGKSNE
jgi:8-oxo-dGTP pyrophosphatase MutT (NUDIX family)/GNAT superfamily N-acetyltransferase